MKTEKLARVRYDEKEDEFILELYDEESESWGFSRSARCVQSVEYPGSTDYIHFSFMKEILRCAEFGYKIYFD